MSHPSEKNTPAVVDNRDAKVEEDFLNVDPEIPGQKFVCLSFVSPDKILDKKDVQFFREFMKQYIQKVRYDATTGFLADWVRRRNGLTSAQRSEKIILADVMEKWGEWHQKKLPSERDFKDVNEAWEDFLFHHEERLDKQFHEANDFQTTVRGVKIRGVQSTHKEAAFRAKQLAKQDKTFDVYVGQVGYWLPWDPRPEQVPDNEQQNKELNTLVKKHKEMEAQKAEMFEKDKEERKRAAEAEAAANAGIPGVAILGQSAAAGGGAAAAAAAAGGAGDVLAAMEGDVPRVPIGAGTLNEDITASHRAEQEAAAAAAEAAEEGDEE